MTRPSRSLPKDLLLGAIHAGFRCRHNENYSTAGQSRTLRECIWSTLALEIGDGKLGGTGGSVSRWELARNDSIL